MRKKHRTRKIVKLSLLVLVVISGFLLVSYLTGLLQWFLTLLAQIFPIGSSKMPFEVNMNTSTIQSEMTCTVEPTSTIDILLSLEPTSTVVVTATAGVTPTVVKTLVPTLKPTFTSTPSPTPTLKPTPTSTPSPTPTLKPTPTSTPSPTPTLKPTPTSTPSPTPTLKPTHTSTPSPTPTLKLTPTSTPGLTMTLRATATIVITPTPTLRPLPTIAPTPSVPSKIGYVTISKHDVERILQNEKMPTNDITFSINNLYLLISMDDIDLIEITIGKEEIEKLIENNIIGLKIPYARISLSEISRQLNETGTDFMRFKWELQNNKYHLYSVYKKNGLDLYELFLGERKSLIY